MLRLFKQCRVYAPENLGVMDILTAGGRVEAIMPTLDVTLPDTEVIDCSGLSVFPGLIDGHAHIAGAGGEGGPATRTPEMQLTDFVSCGITSVIGMLGTDGLVRHPDSVLMKARSLTSEGMSAWMLTGSYQIPPVSITGDPGRDMILIPEVLGAGEIAISDHRDSAPDWRELAKLAKTVRVSGMLSGKPGVVCLHLGDAAKTFDIVIDAVEKGNCPTRHFLPTHCNRSIAVFERAVTFGRRGGFIDLTTSAYPFFPEEEVKPSEAVKRLLARGVPADHICMSSDAGGSLPDFDPEGNLKSITTGDPATIYNEIRDMVIKEDVPLDIAVRFAGINVANMYGLTSKGRIQAGSDADMVFIDDSFSIRHVLIRNCFAVRDQRVLIKGTYERSAQST